MKAHAARASCQSTANARIGEMRAAKSATTREPATDACSAESATDVATAKSAAADVAATTTEAAAGTVTAAATTSSEGVSPDRRHAEGDHRKHDTNFAQHGTLHHGRNGVRFSVITGTPLSTNSGRITKGCNVSVASDLHEIAVPIRLLLRSAGPFGAARRSFGGDRLRFAPRGSP
jgi:hypothetical protein